MSLLEVYNTIHKYDVLDSSVLVDDTTLSHPGYNLVQSEGVVFACITKTPSKKSKKKMQNNQQQTDSEIILQYGAIGSLI